MSKDDRHHHFTRSTTKSLLPVIVTPHPIIELQELNLTTSRHKGQYRSQFRKNRHITTVTITDTDGVPITLDITLHFARVRTTDMALLCEKTLGMDSHISRTLKGKCRSTINAAASHLVNDRLQPTTSQLTRYSSSYYNF